MDILWKSALLVIAATILVRLSGKKSISEMTIASTVIMFSLGEILVRPVVHDGVIPTLIAVAAFLATLVFLEYIQIKFNLMEHLFSGKGLSLIENGKLVKANLLKARFTVDDLEMRLREKGISSLDDVKSAVLEKNGMLGYELKDHAKPLTFGQFKQLLQAYGFKTYSGNQPAGPSGPLFEEVEKNRHTVPVPNELQ